MTASLTPSLEAGGDPTQTRLLVGFTTGARGPEGNLRGAGDDLSQPAPMPMGERGTPSPAALPRVIATGPWKSPLYPSEWCHGVGSHPGQHRNGTGAPSCWAPRFRSMPELPAQAQFRDRLARGDPPQGRRFRNRCGRLTSSLPDPVEAFLSRKPSRAGPSSAHHRRQKEVDQEVIGGRHDGSHVDAERAGQRHAPCHRSAAVVFVP